MEGDLVHQIEALRCRSTGVRRRAVARRLASLGHALAEWWRSYRSEATLINARADMLRDMGLTRDEIDRRIGQYPYL